MADDKAKMLEKVRALLAKAAATEFEGEAQVFRAKADQLMTQYAITAWELEKGKSDGHKPIRRTVDMSWYRGPYKAGIWSLFNTVYKHCRCAVANLYFDGYTIPAVGMEPDLDYADMLFTNLLIELLTRIEPRPSHDLSYEENLAMLKEAGLSWPEAAVRMYEEGMLPFAKDVEAVIRPAEDPEVRTRRIKRELREKVKWYGRCAGAYRRWCKATGNPQNYTHHQTYRLNFALGFNSIVGARLRAMRQEQEVEEHDDNPAALVLRDINATVDDALSSMFPRQADVVKYRRVNRRLDRAAQRKGAEAGAQAKIHVNPTHEQQRRVLPK